MIPIGETYELSECCPPDSNSLPFDTALRCAYLADGMSSELCSDATPAILRVPSAEGEGWGSHRREGQSKNQISLWTVMGSESDIPPKHTSLSSPICVSAYAYRDQI